MIANSPKPENCHVVFVRSINFETPDANADPSNFPDMSNDPFTPAKLTSTAGNTQQNIIPTLETPVRSSSALTAKPAPPPQTSLVELPTCPVCLERMDDTTGLATIFCQHVFHCACLQKWRGSGCPVCRYTQNDQTMRTQASGVCNEPSECLVCGSTGNLWICLICGHVGCGRYDEAHAFAHYEQTSHTFAMDISTQHIWDYSGDEYVHRLIQNKSDGKLVELPSSTTTRPENNAGDSEYQGKADYMSMEYTNLLASQLDSQRLYFEEQVERASDKAAKASARAEQAAEAATMAASKLEFMQTAHSQLVSETIPTSEKDKERAMRRAERFEVMARTMEKEWKEKEVINESLMNRINHLETQLNDVTLRNSDLEEQNRDLSFFISGTERLKNQGDDVQEGTVVVQPATSQTKKKKKKGDNQGKA